MDRSAEVSASPGAHPVQLVHRIGSTVLGVGLIGFGFLGLLDMPTFFGPGGRTMGMGSNGALAVLSVLVGALLLLAAARGGRASSTVSIVVGALFLLSGFVHLAILDTAANLLGFGLPNVFFSFAAGLLLLTLGAYGRITGGLPADNPYVGGGDTLPTGEDRVLTSSDDAMAAIEEAVATGHATVEQRAQLRAHRIAMAGEAHDRSWQDFATTHTESEVARMQQLDQAESAVRHPDPSP